jgi:Outer membrane receptor for ferrienterochelin and colicins
MKTKQPRLYFITLYFMFLGTLIAQTAESKSVRVSGTVLDPEHNPVKKAIIYLDSVNTGIRTDKNGHFEIDLDHDNKVIMAFSAVYGIQSVDLVGSKEIQIVFPEGGTVVTEKDLSEHGFNTKGKVRNKKEPKDYSKYLDMYQLIATEVPGAQVNGTKIRLRGNALNSVNSGQEPLLIVDGTVVSSIDYIMPRDVASVEVIRDEKASLYGTRGANGVIVIKMKK